MVFVNLHFLKWRHTEALPVVKYRGTYFNITLLDIILYAIIASLGTGNIIPRYYLFTNVDHVP
jgi:hypothetical protein